MLMRRVRRHQGELDGVQKCRRRQDSEREDMIRVRGRALISADSGKKIPREGCQEDSAEPCAAIDIL